MGLCLYMSPVSHAPQISIILFRQNLLTLVFIKPVIVNFFVDLLQEALSLSTTTVQNFIDDVGSQATDIFVAPRICNEFLKGQDDKFVSLSLSFRTYLFG